MTKKEASERWVHLCQRAGETVAEKVQQCGDRISRAVVDLKQSQATFKANLVFKSKSDGELYLQILCSEPTVKLEPVEMKLSEFNGQLGLFEGAPAEEE